MPSHQQVFEALLAQAADGGRDAMLFGGGAERMRAAAPPFLLGDLFPETFLEFPLAGEPFLDATILYGDLPQGSRVDSALAAGCEEVFDFCVRERTQDSSVGFGFEIDGARLRPGAAAIHFQPHERTDLVAPFCAAAGCPDKAGLYLSQCSRMPEQWPLAYFGVFRGRADSPLRVCGYLERAEVAACAADPRRIGRALAQAGFRAFDEDMLSQAARILALAPTDADFQLDVFPDGHVGDMFAIDIRFDKMTAAQVLRFFAEDGGAAIARQLREWDAADERMQAVAAMSFTRGLKVPGEDGSPIAFGMKLVPAWLKVRWRAGALQPAKAYMKAGGGPVRALSPSS